MTIQVFIKSWQSLQSNRRPQGICPISAFPGQIQIVPAKVTVGGRLLVDRSAQVKIADDGAGPQIKDLGYQCSNLVI